MTDPASIADARQELENILYSRRRAEASPWEGWYRGDRKENLPAVLSDVSRIL